MKFTMQFDFSPQNHGCREAGSFRKTRHRMKCYFNYCLYLYFQGVRDESVKHLIQSTGFDTLKKLQIADRDNLIALRVEYF